MTALEKHCRVSVEDYLDGEEAAELKHEYLGGVVYAMSGTTDRHNIIAGNAFVSLRSQLRGGPCQVFMSDLKARVEAGESCFYYPDVMVACDPSDDQPLYRERPTAIFEVLSDSTERIDRREKLLAYRTIAELRHYVLVDQKRVDVLAYHWVGGKWEAESLDKIGEVLRLASLGVSLSLEEIYEDSSGIAD